MIVYKDKSYKRWSEHPGDDWQGDADFVLDDNKDSELEEKIISLYPNYDFVLDKDGRLIDVVETEPVPVPPIPEPPTNAELAAAVAELAEIIMGGMM